MSPASKAVRPAPQRKPAVLRSTTSRSASRPIVSKTAGSKIAHPAQTLGQTKPRSFTAVPVSSPSGPVKKKRTFAMPRVLTSAASSISTPKGMGKIVGIVVGVVAVLVIAALIVINSGLFAATDIQIKGSEHVSQHDAQQLIDIPEGTSLFNVDTDAIVDNLKQNPWVSGVDVERRYPHTLVVTPTERKVLAIAYITSDELVWAIGDDDTWIAPLSTTVDVDDQGNIVTSGKSANTLTGLDAALALAKHYGAVLLTDVSADVEPVSGQAVSSKVVKCGLEYARGFSSDFLSQVKDISIPSVEAISANLTSGVEVSLGDASDIAKKERIVTKLLSQVEGVTYINVRSAGNYTFRNAPTS